MNGLLLLPYCARILGVLLLIPGCTCTPEGTNTTSSSYLVTSLSYPNEAPTNQSEVNTLMISGSPTTVLQSSTSRRPSLSPCPQLTTTATSIWTHYGKTCFMVNGGLIIACTILLISTVLLVWKVCQLSRHVKMLSSNADLVSNSEYWMGTAKKNKKESETEAKETSVLMVDLAQTQEEMNNGTAKEDEGKVNKDGKIGEEKEVDDTANNKKASPVTAEENSPSSKPQEEAADSQSTKAAAASSSEGAEDV
ncbi:uncharacterized protein [Embiotoca jacksoni]|uniref:uncharacterized protein n=1 Tax=Embiotoca jacksoni TaxID=100190 RepID=UPI0037048C31